MTSEFRKEGKVEIQTFSKGLTNEKVQMHKKSNKFIQLNNFPLDFMIETQKIYFSSSFLAKFHRDGRDSSQNNLCNWE